MSYQFQPIGEVEKLDEVPKTANAIVEVDGKIKRVPGSGLGGAVERFDAIFTVVHTGVGNTSQDYTVTCNKSFEEIDKLMEETGWVSALLTIPDDFISATNVACSLYYVPSPALDDGPSEPVQSTRYRFLFGTGIDVVDYLATGEIIFGG